MSAPEIAALKTLEDLGPLVEERLKELLPGQDRVQPLWKIISSEKAELKLEKRLTLVEQALILFRDYYVNRPLKEAVHGVLPVRRLELMRLRLERMIGKGLQPEDWPHPVDFHGELTEIFMSVHDRHMRYLLPAPFRDRWAVLGFDVESYYAPVPADAAKREKVEASESARLTKVVHLKNGKLLERRYMVSRVVNGLEHKTFRQGAEVVSLNGVPIERAVAQNGDLLAGSNPAARHARGLMRLTIRPLWVSPPPEERWVIVGYKPKDAKSHDVLYVKFDWWVTTLGSPELPSELDVVDVVRVGPSPPPSSEEVVDEIRMGDSMDEALDDEEHAIQQLRWLVSTQNLVSGNATDADPTSLRGVLKEELLKDGKYLYLRIYTFKVKAEALVTELIRLRRKYDKIRGLILDVRDNGGGDIPAGERLLGLLSPDVMPERFEFLNTRVTQDFCRGLAGFEKWHASLVQGAEIGALYSRGIPITSPEQLPEPIFHDVDKVLIVNALSYSTTDMFAAGFQDHRMGTILATDDNVGAGGANTAEHADLLRLGGKGLKTLPKGARMKVAIRRALRVGKNAGTPLEHLGIRPRYRYYMTGDDVLDGNKDLKAKACSILRKRAAEKRGS